MKTSRVACSDEGCRGELDMHNGRVVRIGDLPVRDRVYPCRICGLMHWGDGRACVLHRGGHALLKDGKILSEDGDEHLVGVD